ncbi:MAG: MBL fold metallo-hydrolase [Chitinophagia bacterium]|nr:MBL fold metallo-hydrolase [Chitinophagia bacterium]
MGLQVASLNSGSNANCYYIGNENEAVLIDAGLHCRETEKRLKQLRLNLTKIRAVFISHEHHDHIKGLEGLATKHHLPVYITPKTLRNSRLRATTWQVHDFTAYEPVTIGDLSILAFPKLHDADDPHSFVVSGGGVNVGVFTDIGEPCEHVINNFKTCHAIFLESNYDEKMLWEGRYNASLKARVAGKHGHLSNRQALELVLAHQPPQLRHIYLSHLSQVNNTPEIALSLFQQYVFNAEVIIASRYGPTGVFNISSDERVAPCPAPVKAAPVVQASLFA